MAMSVGGDGSEEKPLSDINTTPLVDVMLVLLIIFLIAVPVVVQSVELGYKEASRTIFEANMTHAISGIIMFLLGSGPVKGFAVVLLIGIATSVFTAVLFTRMLTAQWLRRAKPKTINI